MVHGGRSGGGTQWYDGAQWHEWWWWYTVVYGGTRWQDGARWHDEMGYMYIYIQWVAPAKCEEQMYNGIYSAVYCLGGRRGPT